MAAEPGAWPELPVLDWQPTRDTFQLWLQVVGKVKMARAPLVNHWWATTLQVTSAGLSTGLVPAGPGRGFSVDLDLVDHELLVRRTDGRRRRLDLVPMSVRAFHAEVTGMLADLDLETEIWPVPVEIPDAVPFPDDDLHDAYDDAAVTDFWRSLVEADRVLAQFRARFVGKSSPVHLFWGALDLAVTRFSGRSAPAHPGGAPNCGPHVMHEAYSHEVSSAGYWPGGEGEGSSTPTPTPSRRRATGTPRCCRRRPGGTTSCRSSSCPTRPCARPGRGPDRLPAEQLRGGGGLRRVGPPGSRARGARAARAAGAAWLLTGVVHRAATTRRPSTGRRAALPRPPARQQAGSHTTRRRRVRPRRGRTCSRTSR